MRTLIPRINSENTIPFNRLSNNIGALFQQIIRNKEAIIVEMGKGQFIEIMPVYEKETKKNSKVVSRVKNLPDKLQALQDRIRADRGGRIITNLDEILEETHDERDNAILGLR